MRNKITQKEAIFYILYQAFKDTPDEYVPVFKFMGEVYAKEVGLWGFVSHECSARASELKWRNPQLIQSKEIVGKSGAKYYGYRINPEVTKEMILDPALYKFYLKIRKQQQLIEDTP